MSLSTNWPMEAKKTRRFRPQRIAKKHVGLNRFPERPRCDFYALDNFRRR